MERFSRQYVFKFVCHEVGHSDRKAGNERSFYTVETNFFPGRTFLTPEDLNRQAFEWSTIRMALRPVSKSGLIPAKVFEYEKSYLNKLTPHLPPPYRVHERGTDQYGYASVDGNYYWLPGTRRDDVTVLEYSDCLKIYLRRKLLTEYPLPPYGVKNEKFSPEGMPKPRYSPKWRKKPTQQEEKRLRESSGVVDEYLNFALPSKGIKRHRFLRELFGLFQKVALPVFIKALRRALKYRITDIETIERIIILQMNDGQYEIPLVEVDKEFEEREAYIEGRLTDKPDLSIYDKMLKEEGDG